MKRRATGPVPLRTARGARRGAVRRWAGRLAEALPRLDGRALLVVLPLVVPVLLLGVFRALRDRVLEPLRPLLLALDEDVLLLRDPAGEDVRVAIRPN